MGFQSKFVCLFDGIVSPCYDEPNGANTLQITKQKILGYQDHASENLHSHFCTKSMIFYLSKIKTSSLLYLHTEYSHL